MAVRKDVANGRFSFKRKRKGSLEMIEESKTEHQSNSKSVDTWWVADDAARLTGCTPEAYGTPLGFVLTLPASTDHRPRQTAIVARTMKAL